MMLASIRVRPIRQTQISSNPGDFEVIAGNADVVALSRLDTQQEKPKPLACAVFPAIPGSFLGAD